jgi:uracil-DNA glycosylase
VESRHQKADRITLLASEITHCRACESWLEPRPVVRLGVKAKLLVIGQAPGTRVHTSGIPWDDASGKRLRTWLGLSPEQFYDAENIAIVPMGFCYPGKGRNGDLPPRPECQHLWHNKILRELTNIRITLLIGQYAQNAYLKNSFRTLTENVSAWRTWFPEFIPIPHPSPRNQLWLKQRPWFEAELVPAIREQIHQLLF